MSTNTVAQIDGTTNSETPQRSTGQAAWVAVRPVPAGTGLVQLTGASGNVANATATATLAAAANQTTYIEGFQVTGAGATAALPVVVTVTGLLGGTQSYIYCARANPLDANEPLFVAFDPPIAASAPNTAIVVTCPALGAGNTNNAVCVQGFRV